MEIDDLSSNAEFTKDFKRLSLENVDGQPSLLLPPTPSPPPHAYDYKASAEISKDDKLAIELALAQNKPYTRRNSKLLVNESTTQQTGAVETVKPEEDTQSRFYTIGSAIKEKYSKTLAARETTPTATAATSSRRSSSKIIPLDMYIFVFLYNIYSANTNVRSSFSLGLL